MTSNTSTPKPASLIIILAYSAATILFITGLFAFFYFLNDYKKLLNPNEYSLFFDKKDDTSSLAGMIASTTGLLWSFAGVILFAFNIRQTQQEIELQIKEMKDQGETFTEQMLAIKAQSELLRSHALAAQNQSDQYNIQTTAILLQQKENSLNNMLNNYFNFIQSFEVEYRKDKLTGYLALNHIYFHIKNAFGKYLQSFSHSSFSDSYILQYQYLQIFEGNYKPNLDAVIKNFESMHKFIKSNFSDSEPYFNRLYNCYSDAEKYIIGHYIINSHEDKEIFISPFDFTSFAKEKNYYDKAIHYLPVVSLDFSSNNELILEKKRVPLTSDIDFDSTLKKVSEKLYLSCEIIENENDSAIAVELLSIDFTTTSINTGTVEKGKIDFGNKKFVFESKEFKIPFSQAVQKALRFLESRNPEYLRNTELSLITNLQLKINHSEITKIIEISFSNTLEISEATDTLQNVIYILRIKR